MKLMLSTLAFLIGAATAHADTYYYCSVIYTSGPARTVDDPGVFGVVWGNRYSKDDACSNARFAAQEFADDRNIVVPNLVYEEGGEYGSHDWITVLVDCRDYGGSGYYKDFEGYGNQAFQKAAYDHGEVQDSCMFMVLY